MKRFNQYDYLSGIVTVKRTAPSDWKDLAVLPFWGSPNDERWGVQLSRVLYHEALHFWQFLNSPYLIRLVGKLWEKLIEFEKTGELSFEYTYWGDYNNGPSKEFSNYELVECWARFWDVHSRNPINIIKEENIEVDDLILDYRGFYIDRAYDIVMTKGPNCQLSAKPYRWLLDKCSDNSLLANVLFPLITNASFSTLKPSVFFQGAIELAIKSREINDIVLEYSGQAINLIWLKCWDTVMAKAVVPFSEEADDTLIPFQEAGYQAIEEGPLSSHPIISHYIMKANGSNFKLWFSYFSENPLEQTPDFYDYTEWINDVAKKIPVFGVFGMPGQPFYRSTLGTLVPPPRVEFNNFVWNSPKIIEIDVSGLDQHRAQNKETFAEDYEELIPRIKRFRYALEAVKLGLPPNAFNLSPSEA